LRATCDELWLVADGKVTPFDGDLDDYADWLNQSRAAENPPSAKRASGAGKAKPTRHARRRRRRSPKSRRWRHGDRLLKESPRNSKQQIAGWQNELKLLETRLADPTLYADADGRLPPNRLRSQIAAELAPDWRDGGYPYRNLMTRKNYEKQKYHGCRSSCSSCRPGSRKPARRW
jgi:ATP-binding cassette subfamily F protein 3